ncbi:MAG: oxidoreductase, partial [Pseudomonadota bacterium]
LVDVHLLLLVFGIGYEVTKGLLKNGFHVVIASRNLEKANQAKKQILSDLSSSQLDVMPIDLADFESIKTFAQTFKSKFQRLDILVNNAGVLFNKLQKNKNNIEMQFATNHLGHFLLTSLLIELMPNSKGSRIVSLSSIAHKKSKIFFDDINCDSQTKWDTAYAQSKLACLIFADELQRRLTTSGKKILSVAAHPGGADSDLFKNMPPILMYILRYTFVPLFLHSTENAAKPILKAALDRGLNGGEYFGPAGLFEMKGPPDIAKRTIYSQRKDIARRLWDKSEELIG